MSVVPRRPRSRRGGRTAALAILAALVPGPALTVDAEARPQDLVSPLADRAPDAAGQADWRGLSHDWELPLDTMASPENRG